MTKELGQKPISPKSGGLTILVGIATCTGVFLAAVFSSASYVNDQIAVHAGSPHEGTVDKFSYGLHVDHEHEVHNQILRQLELLRKESREDMKELTNAIREAERDD